MTFLLLLLLPSLSGYLVGEGKEGEGGRVYTIKSEASYI